MKRFVFYFVLQIIDYELIMKLARLWQHALQTGIMTSKTELKIFIVDDDAICREFYKQHLLNMGFENVMLFDNGQQCIDQLDQNPDIILLDHQMKPIDGLDTLKKIKRFNPDIFLIYISGQDDLEVAVNALKYGAFDYIIKGNAKEEEKLVAVMNKILVVIELLSKKTSGKWSKFLSLFSN